MLDLKDVSIKRDQKIIIKNLNLSVSSGTVTAVMGPSGIGKSSLVAAICQLLPYDGQILWNKHKLSTKKTIIGWMPQDYGLFPWMRVKDNISREIIIRKRHSLNEEDRQNIQRLCYELKINQLIDKFPGELSGGQKQRVALAKALALTPDLLLLDEPFSALDNVVKQQAYQLLSEELTKHPVTTLIITHDLREAVIFGDQLLFLNKHSFCTKVNPLSKLNLVDRKKSSQFSTVVTKLKNEVRQEWSEE